MLDTLNKGVDDTKTVQYQSTKSPEPIGFENWLGLYWLVLSGRKSGKNRPGRSFNNIYIYHMREEVLKMQTILPGKIISQTLLSEA